MATALSTLVDALKRELAVPGTFDDIFPDTGDSDLVGSLADGFAEAQLQGFFPTVALTRDAAATPTDWIADPDLSLAGGALVVIFTSMRFIRAQLRNLNTVERYKAGAAEFEIQHAATVLTAELAYLKERLADLIKQAKDEARLAGTLAAVYDNYLARGCDISGCGGFAPWEYC